MSWMHPSRRRCRGSPSGWRSRTPAWCARRRVRHGTARAPRAGGAAANVPSVSQVDRSGECTVCTSRFEQTGAVQLAQQGGDAAGAVHVLHVEARVVRRHLRQARHPRADRVDVGQGEVDLALLRGGQDVQHGVRRAAHRDIERHRIGERRLGGDRCGAAPSRRRRRSSARASSTISDRPAGTGPCGRRAWPAWSRCPATTVRAPR